MKWFTRTQDPTPLEQAQGVMLQDYRDQLRLERDRITALLALAVNPSHEPPQPFLDRVRYAYAIFKEDMTVTGVVAEEYLVQTLGKLLATDNELAFENLTSILWDKTQWKGATPALWESEFNGTPIKIIRIEP